MKMRANVAAVRTLSGRSLNNNTRCRRCDDENETLGHVVGKCRLNEPAITRRHHDVCDAIANELRSSGSLQRSAVLIV